MRKCCGQKQPMKFRASVNGSVMKVEIQKIIHSHRSSILKKHAYGIVDGNYIVGKRNREGGYTRLLRTRILVGDAAPMAYIE
ncbi:hypothetical protein KSP40_PGU000631 [Platanthera guangdongensis]|uniref:Uncharacterized protein n=1 Tax=Platanthera guangdongensis TaxID=2320717 RepID=A0ABR2M448_9ASPA